MKYLLLVSLVILSGCYISQSNDVQIPIQSNERIVKYYVNSYGLASIYYKDEDSITKHIINVSTPWDYTFTSMKSNFVFLIAYDQSDVSILLKIIVDDNVWLSALATTNVTNLSGVLP